MTNTEEKLANTYGEAEANWTPTSVSDSVVAVVNKTSMAKPKKSPCKGMGFCLVGHVFRPFGLPPRLLQAKLTSGSRKSQGFPPKRLLRGDLCIIGPGAYNDLV